MSDNIITDEHITKGADNNLGPHYYTARDVAEKVMDAWETHAFDGIINRCKEELYRTLQDSIEDFLLSDTESNIQSTIWRTVDQIVRGILSGEKWIVNRYALGKRYDCEKARAAIAKHVPRELQDARIADLEAEVSRLKEALEWARR